MHEGNELVMREENINYRLMPGQIHWSSHVALNKALSTFTY